MFLVISFVYFVVKIACMSIVKSNSYLLLGYAIRTWYMLFSIFLMSFFT